MKKIYLSLFTVLAGLSLQAQLNQANQAPQVNDAFQLYQCDSLGINPGAAGANATWNFAAVATHSNIITSYLTGAVSNNTSYPNATIDVGASANNQSYYNSTATELDYYGGNISVGPVSASLIYTSAAVRAIYPMNINTTTTSAIGGSVSVTSPFPVSGTFIGNCTVIADGTGTLTLPGTNATFTSAIRVMTSQTLNITTSAANATVNQVTYDYYSVGIRNPIFTINTATAVISGPFGSTTTQTLVTRDKNAVNTTTTTTTTTGIAENVNTTFNLNVYPNPSSSYVQFVSDSQNAQLVSLYDITGKLVDRQNFSDGKVKLDVSSLNIGLYIYTVSGSNNRAVKTGKITVSH